MKKEFRGGQGLYTIASYFFTHSTSLCLFCLPGTESEVQYKDLTLEGKVLWLSRYMTLDKLHYHLQLNGDRTREPIVLCCEKEQTASI